MATEDVIHAFFVPDFRVKADIVPGRYTTAWFEAIKPGRYHLFARNTAERSFWHGWLGNRDGTRGISGLAEWWSGEKAHFPLRVKDYFRIWPV